MNSRIKLLWATPDCEYQIVRSTRICWDSGEESDSRWVQTDDYRKLMVEKQMTLGVPLFEVKLGSKDEALLRKIMSNQHNTCLRFASAAFHIEGISRVCSHQLVRIANFGLLQRSQRYCLEDGTGFILPTSLEFDDEVLEFNKAAENLYRKLIANGVKEEDARYVLPSSSSTQLDMTSNFQGWKHFLSIRLAKKVQYETRLVAAKLCQELYKLAPIVFEEDYNKLDKISLGN